MGPSVTTPGFKHLGGYDGVKDKSSWIFQVVPTILQLCGDLPLPGHHLGLLLVGHDPARGGQHRVFLLEVLGWPQIYLAVYWISGLARINITLLSLAWKGQTSSIRAYKDQLYLHKIANLYLREVV